MFGRGLKVLGAVALLAGLFQIVPPHSQAEDHSSHVGLVRIGLIASLFSDVPEPTVMAMMQPLGALMEAHTGVSGELVSCGDAENLGQQLTEDKVQLGVFHGIEFAWARQKHPELRPLVIAVNQQHHLRAHLIVRANGKIANLGDLQGKALAFPHASREHSQLFLRRRCQEFKKEPANFFAKITNPANAEDALDDLVDGAVQACVIDGVSFDCYKRRKPGRCQKLRILQSSEIFPAGVIAFRSGFLDEATLARVREGMININRTVAGKQLMTLWKLTGFEPVPADYDQTLTEIIKAYPAPEASGKCRGGQ
jgi:ABC-type phosphate/phosphonate transport system substrate-binding protein